MTPNHDLRVLDAAGLKAIREELNVRYVKCLYG